MRMPCGASSSAIAWVSDRPPPSRRHRRHARGGDLGELRGDIDDASANSALPHHLPCRLLPQMEHAGQVDRDDALPFSGIDVEKGGGLTDADAVEEYIQSAEFAPRRRNRGVDEPAVAYIEIKRRSASAGSANLRGGRLGRGGIDIGADHRCAFTSETESTRPADPATPTATSAPSPSTRSMPTLPPMFLLRTISVTHLGSS